MMDVIRRWSKTAGLTAFVCASLTASTGCGALKAAANPKVAWAVSDPAPMSVVVRRADVAEKTAQNVDRLMTDTPANDDSPWLTKVGPDKDAASQQMVELRKHDLYAQNVRIVAAEVWAKSLADLEPKDAKAAAAAPAPAAPAADPPAAVASADSSAPAAARTADPPAPVEKEAKPAKKGGKKRAKSDKGADKAASKKAPATDDKPVDASAAAPAAAPAPAAASATPAKYPSLLAAIDKDLGDSWGKVMEKKKAVGDLKGQIAVLEAANDEKGVSDADKKANKAKIDDLEKQVDAAEDQAKQLAKDFVPKAKTAASKAAPDVRDRVGAALVNLRQAVDDANTANSAAAIRYPLAAKSILDSAQTMAKVYVADVIEEKTGKRPSTQSLQPGVTLEGGKVQVTINGLSQADMGKLSAGDVTSEVASRTSAWVKRAMGLLGVIAATKEVLEFEDDVLGALLDGFKSSGWNAPAAATIPDPPPAAGAPKA